MVFNRQQAAPLPMCYYGHPALTRRSDTIPKLSDETRELCDRMIATMQAHDGIGLAAPQIGLNLRLVVLEIPMIDTAPELSFLSPGERALLPQMPLALIDPKLSHMSTNVGPYLEGCLSIPGVNAEVIRPEFLELEATLLSGETVSYRCGGLLARCLQHEVDHLNGILFIDLISQEDREEMAPTLQKLHKRTDAALKKAAKKGH